MLAGLHEIRARLAEEDPWLKQLHAQVNSQPPKKPRKITSRRKRDTCKREKLVM
jgi:hypothetical protein